MQLSLLTKTSQATLNSRPSQSWFTIKKKDKNCNDTGCNFYLACPTLLLKAQICIRISGKVLICHFAQQYSILSHIKWLRMMKTIFFPPLIGSFAVILTSYSFSAEQHAHNRQLLLLVSSLPTVLHQILFLFLKQLTSQLLFFLLFPLQITNKESRSSSPYIYIY